MAHAILVSKNDKGELSPALVEPGTNGAPDAAELEGDGDVLVEVTHSSLNYKDALALGGSAQIVRRPPLVAGIDAVGTVLEATGEAAERFSPGDSVTLNGEGLGETHHGGYQTRLRLPAEKLLRLPEGIDRWHAAAIGTAGYTAALSVNALAERVEPGDGTIVLTGATGGVGSVALALLSTLGYRVAAVTGRREEYGDYLTGLGAAEILDRAEFSEQGKRLQSARFAGGVDTVGSHTLVNVLAQVQWGGTVTACGMAQGNDLPGTVIPFILRSVHLAGIDSVTAPLPVREAAWETLAKHLDLDVLEGLSQTIGLGEVIDAGEKLLAGQWHGRTVVDVAD